MFANLYLARRTFDINFSAVKMAVGGLRHEGHLGRRTRRQFALSISDTTEHFDTIWIHPSGSHCTQFSKLFYVFYDLVL